MSEATAPAEAGQAEAPAETGQAQSQAPEQSNVSQETQSESAWYDSAPDEVKGYIQNKGWDDPIKAVTSYQELEKYRGASEDQLLKLPKDPDEEGAMDEIWNRLGRPESPDDYEVELPEGVNFDDSRLQKYAEVAHKLGINKNQFKALAELDAQYQMEALEEMQKESAQQQEAEYNALKKEWGSNAGEREELARRGLRSVLPEGVDKESVIANIEKAIGTANTLKMFANVGDKLAREDKIHDSGDTRPFGYTREQALADRKTLMAEIQGDPQRLDNYNKGKGADIEKMQRLNKVIAG